MMRTTGPETCPVCGRYGNSMLGCCHRCLPGLTSRFERERWTGCNGVGCVATCSKAAGLCGRFRDGLVEFIAEQWKRKKLSISTAG